MFDTEQAFLRTTDEYGKQKAVELSADINQYTRLYTPKEPVTEQTAKPRLLDSRTLLDHNEHFIELSNGREYLRTLFFMLALWMYVLLPAIPIAMAIASFSLDGFGFPTIFSMMLLFGALIFLGFLWPVTGAPVLFTALRARYRFNRTTRKVYVLRPQRYGGNVILDWDRVQAHVSWRSSGKMTYEQLSDPVARRMRQNNLDITSLVLYWSPLDAGDPERKGEEILWVGSATVVMGEFLWQYIRTFMEEGIDAVPVPNEFEWLRKGYSSPAQLLEEAEMHLSRVDEARARDRDGKVDMGVQLQTSVNFFTSVIWTPLRSLAERLCYWPMFPEEWNSDCGQKRRESGLGPEEPLRWQAK
ncbi:MAG: MFS transporter [Burkholderiaceae bacterium]|nr:MFS transporter [Burkholderiaceae bacterium]